MAALVLLKLQFSWIHIIKIWVFLTYYWTHKQDPKVCYWLYTRKISKFLQINANKKHKFFIFHQHLFSLLVRFGWKTVGGLKKTHLKKLNKKNHLIYPCNYTALVWNFLSNRWDFWSHIILQFALFCLSVLGDVIRIKCTERTERDSEFICKIREMALN